MQTVKEMCRRTGTVGGTSGTYLFVTTYPGAIEPCVCTLCVQYAFEFVLCGWMRVSGYTHPVCVCVCVWQVVFIGCFSWIQSDHTNTIYSTLPFNVITNKKHQDKKIYIHTKVFLFTNSSFLLVNIKWFSFRLEDVVSNWTQHPWHTKTINPQIDF